MGAPFFGLRIVFENIAGLAYIVCFSKELSVRDPWEPVENGKKGCKPLQDGDRILQASS
jgi:hypothetical protein